jgi:pre-mRNA-splicing factor ISY1
VGAGAKQQRKGQLAGGGGGGGGLGGGGGAEEDGGTQFVAYVPLPDQAAIEQRILEKKVRGSSWRWSGCVATWW